MKDFEKIKLKFWFHCGTYIEKECRVEDINETGNVYDVLKVLKDTYDTISACFTDELSGHVKTGSLIIRTSELIAFEAVPVMEEKEE